MKRWLSSGFCVLLLGLALYPLAGTGYGIRFMLQLFMWIALSCGSLSPSRGT